MQTVKNATSAGTLTTYQSIAGGMKISDGSQSYEVKFDGKDYPVSGDAHSTVSLKLIDEYTLEETDKQDGKSYHGHPHDRFQGWQIDEGRILRQTARRDDDLHRREASVHLSRADRLTNPSALPPTPAASP